MARALGSIISGSILVMLLALSAYASPIVAAPSLGFKTPHANFGGVFDSSLQSAGTSAHHDLHESFGSGFGPHQFSLRVPPPVSEAPEPSSLALFGTGATMLAGIVRRKFRR